MNDDWKPIKLPGDAELLRKDWFSYRIGNDLYDIELFESQTGDFYAIGTPADKSKLIVYGSAIVKDSKTAVEQALRKINREYADEEEWIVGMDAPQPTDSADD